MLALLASPQSVRAAQPARIKHVVVLFEENRAFDHFLGHHTDLHVDGLKGDESNPIFLSDPSKGNITVFDGAPYVSTAHRTQHSSSSSNESVSIALPSTSPSGATWEERKLKRICTVHGA